MSKETIVPATLSLLDKNGSAVKKWELAGKRSFHMGRSKGNDIPLPYTWVSRQHAMVQVEESGVYTIMDLGSSNGTLVNGKRQLSATRLFSGDRIQVGSAQTSLIFLHDYVPPKSDDLDLETDEETVAFLQKQVVTVLVCDIRNFTRLSEVIGAEPLSNLISGWSKKVDELVSGNNGNVDKFIGDAVMAIWTSSNKKEDITLAMKTALAISDMTKALSDKLPDLPWPLAVGGAINSGEAVTGNIGVDGRRDSTVVGDVVNVTFRLEELTTKVGMDMLLGGDAAELLESEDYFTLCKYMVKGKKEPVAAYGCSFEQITKFLELQEKDEYGE